MKTFTFEWNLGWPKYAQILGAAWIIFATLCILAKIVLPHFGIGTLSDDGISKMHSWQKERLLRKFSVLDNGTAGAVGAQGRHSPENNDHQ